MPKKKKGRPTIFSQKLASEICVRLAIGESLVEITREEKMPGYRTVMTWLFTDWPEDDPRYGFRQLCARAREAQAETYADQMVVIADDEDGSDVLYDMDGHPVAANNVRIQRHKLRVDTRKWIVSKLLRRYSDRVAPEIDEKVTPIEVEVLEPRELARQVALILYRGDPKRLTDQRKE